MEWELCDVMLPFTGATTILIAGLITVIALVCHMVLGSCIAVMGLVCPAMVALAGKLGISPLIPAFLAYGTIYAHYVFPHHNLAILVGWAEDKGGYDSKQTIRMGIPLTVVVFIVTCLAEVGWFHVVGLWK